MPSAFSHGYVIQPEQHWTCPNCDLTDVTHYPAGRPVSRMHNCKGLRGISAPMVPAGTKCKVERIEREDWVGEERVQKDMEGRPFMAVETTRDDGTDRAVYLPCIEVNARSHG